MATMIRSADVLGEGRSVRRREVVVGGAVPVSVRSDHMCDLAAVLREIELGGIRAAVLGYPPMEVHRTPRLIRRADPEAYVVGFNLSGSAVIRRGEQSVRLGSGDVTLHDTSHPFSIYTQHGRGMVVLIPRKLFPLPESKVRRLFMARLSCREGIGALAGNYLQELVRNADGYRPAEVTRLRTVTLELLATMFTRGLDDECSLPPVTGRHALLTQIHSYIRRHLADPALSPVAIAVAHHISVRSLHRLFESQGVTVAAWIRASRLDHCRRDLADPALCDRPVHAIGARWGFTDAAHFARAFRAAYEHAPQEFRRQQVDLW